jgi:hypothetical protein
MLAPAGLVFTVGTGFRERDWLLCFAGLKADSNLVGNRLWIPQIDIDTMGNLLQYMS